MSKHTPGPWTVNELMFGGEVSEHHIFIEPDVAVIERKVAGHDQHDMADARLIAAAPAMLEALEHIAASLYYNDYGDPALLSSFDESIIDAAIKAAKGEA